MVYYVLSIKVLAYLTQFQPLGLLGSLRQPFYLAFASLLRQCAI